MRIVPFIWITLLSALVLAGLDPYIYGLYNHNISVPFIWRTLDATAYPADPLVDQLDYFYSWYIEGIAWLLQWTGASIEQVFFTVHVIVVFFSVLVFFRLAQALTQREDAAYIATLLFAVGFKSLALVRTFEPTLMERSLVLPLQLWALERMLRGKWWGAFGLAGLSFSLHPLSGSYVGFIIGFTALVRHPRRPLLWLGGTALFLLGAMPSLYLKFTHPSPELPMLIPDPTWLEILRLHSAYHVFPFTWDWGDWGKAGAFLIAGGMALKGVGNGPASRRALTACAAVLVLGLIGTVFTEIIPLTLPAQFQFWRSFRFLQYLGIIYIAWLAARAIDGQVSAPYAVLGLALAALSWWGIATHLFKGVLLLFLAIYPGWYLARRYSVSTRAFGLLVVAIIPVLYSLDRYGVPLHNRSEPEWVEAQHWARDHTPVNAAFIVPPAEWGWRIDSKRTCYGDWYDGTQNFFDAGYGRLWMARMELLGYDGDPDDLITPFRRVSAEAIEQAAAEYPLNMPVYAVLYADMSLGNWETVWENKRFRIVSIR